MISHTAYIAARKALGILIVAGEANGAYVEHYWRAFHELREKQFPSEPYTLNDPIPALCRPQI